MLCPCGTGKKFAVCCSAIIEGKKQAISPEQLMRSRYSAYATKNAQYLFDTYANETQQSQSVEEIKHWANSCQWIKLNIINSSSINDSSLSKDSSLPTVEFEAFYLIGNKMYLLREKSRFTLENTLHTARSSTSSKLNNQMRWLYLDGNIVAHNEISTIKRNAPCPCSVNQNKTVKKKFKHCCAKH